MSLVKLTVTACMPAAQSPLMVSVSELPEECQAEAVKVPPCCTPSTATVYSALPFQASCEIFSTSVSGPDPKESETGEGAAVGLVGLVGRVVPKVEPEAVVSSP